MSNKITKPTSPHIVKKAHGAKSKQEKAWEVEIQKLPNNLSELTEKQIGMLKNYYESLLAETEQKFILYYDIDPESDTYGHRMSSYCKAYGHDWDKVKDIPKSYNNIHGFSYQTLQRPRVKKYMNLMRYLQGGDLKKFIPTANKRLGEFIEQTKDDKLSLDAIKELHKLIGTIQEKGINIQINNNEAPESQFHWDNLTDEEMTEYMRLLNKLRDTSDNNNSVQEAEVIEDKENNTQ